MILTIAGIRHITTQRPFVVRVFWIAAQQHTKGRIDKGIMIALILRKKEHLRVLLSSSAQVAVVSALETACTLPAQTCHRQLYLRL